MEKFTDGNLNKMMNVADGGFTLPMIAIATHTSHRRANGTVMLMRWPREE